MLRRHVPADDWLLPLLSSVAVLILAAIAVYALTSVWSRHAGVDEPAPADPADPASPSAAEILDRRLASGEITIAEYERIAEALGRRHAAAAGAVASNGKATVAV